MLLPDRIVMYVVAHVTKVVIIIVIVIVIMLRHMHTY